MWCHIAVFSEHDSRFQTHLFGKRPMLYRVSENASNREALIKGSQLSSPRREAYRTYVSIKIRKCTCYNESTHHQSCEGECALRHPQWQQRLASCPLYSLKYIKIQIGTTASRFICRERPGRSSLDSNYVLHTLQHRTNLAVKVYPVRPGPCIGRAL